MRFEILGTEVVHTVLPSAEILKQLQCDVGRALEFNPFWQHHHFKHLALHRPAVYNAAEGVSASALAEIAALRAAIGVLDAVIAVGGDGRGVATAADKMRALFEANL